MKKEEFEIFAMRASEIILGTRDLTYAFAVVSEKYYMEARPERLPVGQFLNKISAESKLEIESKIASGKSFKSALYISRSPVFDVKPGVEEMLKFWLGLPQRYEHALIILDKPTRIALDSLIQQGIVKTVKESEHDKYRLLESITGNKLHVYELPDGISVFDDISKEHGFFDRQTVARN